MPCSSRPTVLLRPRAALLGWALKAAQGGGAGDSRQNSGLSISCVEECCGRGFVSDSMRPDSVKPPDPLLGLGDCLASVRNLLDARPPSFRRLSIRRKWFLLLLPCKFSITRQDDIFRINVNDLCRMKPRQFVRD